MHGIDVRSSDRVTAERVRFQDLYGDGVRMVGEADALTQNVDLLDCAFVANGRSGISVQGGTRLLDFVGNHFAGTSDQDIDFEPTGADRPRRTRRPDRNSTFPGRPGISGVSLPMAGSATVAWRSGFSSLRSGTSSPEGCDHEQLHHPDRR
jgi:hypothetical protein